MDSGTALFMSRGRPAVRFPRCMAAVPSMIGLFVLFAITSHSARAQHAKQVYPKGPDATGAHIHIKDSKEGGTDTRNHNLLGDVMLHGSPRQAAQRQGARELGDNARVGKEFVIGSTCVGVQKFEFELNVFTSVVSFHKPPTWVAVLYIVPGILGILGACLYWQGGSGRMVDMLLVAAFCWMPALVVGWFMIVLPILGPFLGGPLVEWHNSHALYCLPCGHGNSRCAFTCYGAAMYGTKSVLDMLSVPARTETIRQPPGLFDVIMQILHFHLVCATGLAVTSVMWKSDTLICCLLLSQCVTSIASFRLSFYVHHLLKLYTFQVVVELIPQLYLGLVIMRSSHTHIFEYGLFLSLGALLNSIRIIVSFARTMFKDITGLDVLTQHRNIEKHYKPWYALQPGVEVCRSGAWGAEWLMHHGIYVGKKKLEDYTITIDKTFALQQGIRIDGESIHGDLVRSWNEKYKEHPGMHIEHANRVLEVNGQREGMQKAFEENRTVRVTLRKDVAIFTCTRIEYALGRLDAKLKALRGKLSMEDWARAHTVVVKDAKYATVNTTPTLWSAFPLTVTVDFTPVFDKSSIMQQIDVGLRMQSEDGWAVPVIQGILPGSMVAKEVEIGDRVLAIKGTHNLDATDSNGICTAIPGQTQTSFENVLRNGFKLELQLQHRDATIVEGACERVIELNGNPSIGVMITSCLFDEFCTAGNASGSISSQGSSTPIGFNPNVFIRTYDDSSQERLNSTCAKALRNELTIVRDYDVDCNCQTFAYSCAREHETNAWVGEYSAQGLWLTSMFSSLVLTAATAMLSISLYQTVVMNSIYHAWGWWILSVALSLCAVFAYNKGAKRKSDERPGSHASVPHVDLLLLDENAKLEATPLLFEPL